MAWCLKLPLDVQQQINYMRFQGTPSARAIKAFEIAADEDYKFSVNAKDPEDYILFPSIHTAQWRDGKYCETPRTTKRRYVFVTHYRMRHLGRKADPYPYKVSAAVMASMMDGYDQERALMREWEEQTAEYRAQAGDRAQHVF